MQWGDGKMQCGEGEGKALALALLPGKTQNNPFPVFNSLCTEQWTGKYLSSVMVRKRKAHFTPIDAGGMAARKELISPVKESEATNYDHREKMHSRLKPLLLLKHFVWWLILKSSGSAFEDISYPNYTGYKEKGFHRLSALKTHVAKRNTCYMVIWKTGL